MGGSGYKGDGVVISKSSLSSLSSYGTLEEEGLSWLSLDGVGIEESKEPGSGRIMTASSQLYEPRYVAMKRIQGKRSKVRKQKSILLIIIRTSRPPLPSHFQLNRQRGKILTAIDSGNRKKIYSPRQAGGPPHP